jgi:TnpA family transposase
MRARGTEHRLRFAVQLCVLRATGRFVPDYQRVPIEAIGYLAQQLELTPVLFLSEPARPATETAQTARIRQYLGYREFDAAAEAWLHDRLEEHAAEGATPAQLLTLAGDLLRSGRIVLPAQSTLERLAASAAAQAIQDLFAQVAAKLPDGFRDAIDDLDRTLPAF